MSGSGVRELKMWRESLAWEKRQLAQAGLENGTIARLGKLRDRLQADLLANWKMSE